MVDLLCDPDLQPFYEQVGMRRASGMFLRNYAAHPATEGARRMGFVFLGPGGGMGATIPHHQ